MTLENGLLIAVGALSTALSAVWVYFTRQHRKDQILFVEIIKLISGGKNEKIDSIRKELEE